METHETTNEELDLRFRRLKKPERQRLAAIGSKACSNYWTLVEHRLEFLNRFALEPVTTRDGKIQSHETAWGKHVRRSAGDSYEQACPHETPRQIRAYALGLNALFAPSPSEAEAEIEKEVEA